MVAESRRRDPEGKRGDIIWMPVVDLNRSVPVVGFRRIAEEPLPHELAAGIRETIHRPITDCSRAK